MTNEILDDDIDGEEDLSPELMVMIQRLQNHIDQRETHRVRQPREQDWRRRIEDWDDRRSLRRHVDYLDLDLDVAERSRARDARDAAA